MLLSAIFSLPATGAFAIFIQVGAIILLLGTGLELFWGWWVRRKNRVQSSESQLVSVAAQNEAVVVTVNTLPPDGSGDWASHRPNSARAVPLKSHPSLSAVSDRPSSGTSLLSRPATTAVDRPSSGTQRASRPGSVDLLLHDKRAS